MCRFKKKKSSLRLTALRTLLSRGFLLGSLVEERMPVPQLLAKVFLERSTKPTPGGRVSKSPRVSLSHTRRYTKQPHCTTWPQMDCESCFVIVLLQKFHSMSLRNNRNCYVFMLLYSPIKECCQQTTKQDFVFDSST